MIWPNEEIEIAVLYIPTAAVKVRWGRSWNKMGYVFSLHVTIEHENGIYRRVKSLCENCGVSFGFIRTSVSRKTTLILQRGSPLGPSFKNVQ